MIYSMTGFARVERQESIGHLSWELRSVNHRYLEISLRLPEDLRAFEPQVREKIGQRLRRGKVDAQFRFQPVETAAAEFAVDRDLVGRIEQAVADLKLPALAAIDPLDLLRWPGVVKEPQVDADTLQHAAFHMLDEALTAMVRVRAEEGQRLVTLLRTRCEGITALVGDVRQRLPEARAAIRERLEARLAEFKVTADPERLEQELALIAQKMDVAEELDRLDSHLVEMGRTLVRDEPVGRRMDFLLQEFNREANTLASKSQDAETTRIAVEIKVLIEQMREQVQNLE
ncbi:MAG: YicC/YloC family endoribonuclease [Pseudomonadota bacterium]|nr:YicC/YloC family endoribonuclease [Pseudomonadota bacterium]